MSAFESLGPDDAADRIAQDPDSVCFPIKSFLLQFGLSKDEVMQELRSGRLVATGRPTSNGGYDDVAISGGAFCRWVANPRTPRELAARAMQFMSGEPTQ